MSIRLDPRRLNLLKELAAQAGTRPGELVQIWIEERLDAERRGGAAGPGNLGDLAGQVAALADRVTALEASAAQGTDADDATERASAEPASFEVGAPSGHSVNGDRPTRRRRRNAVSARPSGDRVALHDEIIAVIRERGPMSAAELASAIVERGRYHPPRSGKALDALTVNARVSNPTYRSRFTRSEGRIGLADDANANAEQHPAADGEAPPAEDLAEQRSEG